MYVDVCAECGHEGRSEPRIRCDYCSALVEPASAGYGLALQVSAGGQVIMRNFDACSVRCVEQLGRERPAVLAREAREAADARG